MDGFDYLGKTKIIMATNRPDTLDPALMRPGRIDRKIEIPLPNEQSRLEILKIHTKPIAKKDEIDYEAIVKLSDGFNGADLRNVATEAGMFALRDDRDYCIQGEFRCMGVNEKTFGKRVHRSEMNISFKETNELLAFGSIFSDPSFSVLVSHPSFRGFHEGCS